MDNPRFPVHPTKPSPASVNRSIRQDIDVSAYAWRFPFGLYKGKQIVSVPDDYLRYIRHTSNNLNTVKRCAEELGRRSRIGHSVPAGFRQRRG